MLVDLSDAATRLAELVDAAVAGEEVVIARGEVPVIRLMPVDRPHQPAARRTPGRWRGRVKLRSDFDEPLDGFIGEER